MSYVIPHVLPQEDPLMEEQTMLGSPLFSYSPFANNISNTSPPKLILLY